MISILFLVTENPVAKKINVQQILEKKMKRSQQNPLMESVSFKAKYFLKNL